jgi:hypothetical protein
VRILISNILDEDLEYDLGEDVLFLKSIEEKYDIFSYRYDVK